MLSTFYFPSDKVFQKHNSVFLIFFKEDVPLFYKYNFFPYDLYSNFLSGKTNKYKSSTMDAKIRIFVLKIKYPQKPWNNNTKEANQRKWLKKS